MVSTIPYTPYSIKSAAAEALQEENSARMPDSEIRAGLAPTDVPEYVDVVVGPNDVAILRLSYPNREPAEDRLWRSSADGKTSVLLGKHTRKVLEVHTSDALAVYGGKGPKIEPTLMTEWISGLPAHAYKTSVRSALLAMWLLARMPSQVRKSILAALRTVAGP